MKVSDFITSIFLKVLESSVHYMIVLYKYLSILISDLFTIIFISLSLLSPECNLTVKLWRKIKNL